LRSLSRVVRFPSSRPLSGQLGEEQTRRTGPANFVSDGSGVSSIGCNRPRRLDRTVLGGSLPPKRIGQQLAVLGLPIPLGALVGSWRSPPKAVHTCTRRRSERSATSSADEPHGEIMEAIRFLAHIRIVLLIANGVWPPLLENARRMYLFATTTTAIATWEASRQAQC